MQPPPGTPRLTLKLASRDAVEVIWPTATTTFFAAAHLVSVDATTPQPEESGGAYLAQTLWRKLRWRGGLL